MKNLISFFAFLIYCSYSIGQGFIEEIDKIFPGSPEASAFAEYGKVPVSLYSGLVDIDLPLLELEGNDFNIPFSLSYHSSGIKVDEISSSIGLGWTLNSGGLITRVVRGRNDEHADGYIGSNQRGLLINSTPITSMSELQRLNFTFAIWDPEPDLYYFNVLGKSGSFTFNAQGEVIMMPANDIIILPPFGPESINNYWTLIDSEGNKYRFGVNNTEVESTRINRVSVGTSSNPLTSTSPTREYTSSWYLSDITTPTTEIFHFDYINSSSTSSTSKSEEYNTLGSDGGYKITTTTTETLNPVILKKVSSNSGYVELLNDSRLDLINAKKITGIRLHNNNDGLVKSIEFNQSYFNSQENCSQPECKRLKLLAVHQNTIKKYEFEYNPLNLPKRGSPQIDHWGYYNGNNLSHLIPRSDPLNVSNYREPNEATTKANILEKITYPTGGYSKFSFGLNSYREGISNLGSGGLRIESIEAGTDFETPIITSYTYLNDDSSSSSGVQYNLPTYAITQMEFYGDNGIFYDVENTIVSSSSYSELLDLKGSNIGYSNIITNNPNGGKEILKYTNLNSNPNILNPNDYFSYAQQGTSLNLINPFGRPFGPYSESRSHQRGLLKEKILKKSDGQEVNHIWNNYDEIPHLNMLEAIGYRLTFAWVLDMGGYAFWDGYAAKYKETNGNYKLINSIERSIHEDGEIDIITNYQYSFSKPTLMTSKEIIRNNSSTSTTLYKYPFNLIGIEQSPYMQNLVDLNRISEPVITELFTGDEKISEHHYKYESSIATGNLVLVVEQHDKKGNGNININNIENRKVRITKYDSGKILEYKLESGIPITLIWGYQDSYPIAKIENATYSQVSSQIQILKTLSNLDYDSCLDSESCNEKDLRSALGNLRDTLPNASVTTYTYDPLIGVTSITDSRGNITYYKYDDFNRLISVKDSEGKIISKNEYHYKGQ
jgi:YD repeat-containing protein